MKFADMLTVCKYDCRLSARFIGRVVSLVQSLSYYLCHFIERQLLMKVLKVLFFHYVLPFPWTSIQYRQVLKLSHIFYASNFELNSIHIQNQ